MTALPKTDDWPSHNAELTRKTTEVLARWSRIYNAGKISRREFFILVDGLYDATSGLIEREVMDLLAQLHADLRTKRT